MNTFKFGLVASFSLLIGASSAVCSAGGNKGPSLEIFANQLPILIGRGQGKSLPITGAVYDSDITAGSLVSLRPKLAKDISCPIFSNGENLLSQTIRANSTSVPFRLIVFVPANHPLGNFTCVLRYGGTLVNPLTNTSVPLMTKGNDVMFTYTVKNKFIF